ncbi:MAG: response regulator transcription factor [Flavobacterium lindanitolerans]|jgi:DNA-binding NarL/FixJ family response regulator|uniref:response regulator n=1 Tax=Flavobacterium TaxID=237 RepID=UPI0006F7D8BB|nr:MULTISPECIES: response regulator transcription factor [Flavobacterium]KQS47768.1 LuxR family transcriptional regulator [Flavobacterium sp. Leaf359]MBL7869168.1 response regulator transcription factor [Flavobacterium lindanitolerans]PZO33784.1 MAG: DNA-binding response regulator [Flavobacteriaceae bacterium]
MDTKIRIYLADDHQVLIDGMLSMLKTNPKFEVAGYSLNGENLVEDVEKSKADVLVMDINMPIKDGIEVLREFATKGFSCKVIILSSYDDVKIIKEVLKLGANGYLSKQSAGENIIEAINVVANGEEYFSQSIRDRIFESFSKIPQQSYINEAMPLSSITERELEVLKLITMEYSGTQIGEELNISTNTVETHRKNLIKKLNVKTTIGLVKYALKHNLIN